MYVSYFSFSIYLFFSFTSAVNNGLGLTPPMSFSTWNSYECNYNETLIRSVVDTFINFGYRTAGYEYIGMDGIVNLKGSEYHIPNKTCVAIQIMNIIRNE